MTKIEALLTNLALKDRLVCKASAKLFITAPVKFGSSISYLISKQIKMNCLLVPLNLISPIKVSSMPSGRAL